MATYKVVRTWYVEAESLTEATEKTKQFNHDMADISLCREEEDEVKEEDMGSGC